jgi:hypothetical protein
MHDHSSRRDRRSCIRLGRSRVEVLVIVVCVLVLLVLLLPTIRYDRSNAKHLKMATMIKQIHTGIIVAGREQGTGGLTPHRENLLIPGQFARKPPEDITVNTTAGLYSLLVVQAYATPDLLVSPLESNPLVRVHADYDYDAWAPDADVYWDPTFAADLETGSGASFAHRPIDRVWRGMDGLVNARFAIVGSRGPISGVASERSLSCDDGTWIGALCFNDNQVVTQIGKPGAMIGQLFGWPDENPFVYEATERAVDQVVAFTREMTEEGAVLQHD